MNNALKGKWKCNSDSCDNNRADACKLRVLRHIFTLRTLPLFFFFSKERIAFLVKGFFCYDIHLTNPTCISKNFPYFRSIPASVLTKSQINLLAH